MIPTDEELQIRLRNPEDQFVERKTAAESKDWLKTAVAFANSAPIGFPCVLFLNVKNDGTPEPLPANSSFEELRQTFGEKISPAHPPIPNFPRVIDVNGTQVLAIIIPGSESRPHFAGPAYVRRGERTVLASEEQYRELIAQAHSKAAVILQWKDKQITVNFMRPETEALRLGPVQYSHEPFVVACNQFYVTLRRSGLESIPLSRIAISFDEEKHRLLLEVKRV